MKTKIAQLAYYVYKIDRRHIQLAYFAFSIIVAVVMRKPSEGGNDPI
jgi:hypothetical protein